METPVFANEKGCALLAAIDAGIIPETESGYDTARFDKFWSLYLRNLAQVYWPQSRAEKSSSTSCPIKAPITSKRT